jgi:FSR family fosmidomycin resistance protein-like MFS transporter
MAVKTSTVAPAELTDKEEFNLGQVLTLAGGHLVHDTFGAFLNPLLPLIIEKLNLSLVLAGSLTLFSRLPSLLHPFIGLWADRIDLRLLVALAPAGSAIAMSLMGLAPNYAMLALLLLIAGLASAGLHVPGPVIVARVSGKRVGAGMSLWMMGGELARTVGPLFAVAAVSWWTLDGYYPIMVLGILTSFVLHFRLKEFDIKALTQHSAAPLSKSWGTLRRFIQPLALVILFRSFMRAALSTFLPTFMVMTSADSSLWFGGTTLAVVEFAGALGALIAGTLSDRINRRLVLFVAMLFGPLLMLLLLAVESGGWLFFLLLALTGFVSLSTTPVIMAMVQDYGREYPATANGTYMGISFLFGALAAMLVGWAGDRVGLQVAFTWSAIVALVGAPFAFLIPRTRGIVIADDQP